MIHISNHQRVAKERAAEQKLEEASSGELATVTAERDKLQKDAAAAEEKVVKLEAELREARDRITTLEAQVNAHSEADDASQSSRDDAEAGALAEALGGFELSQMDSEIIWGSPFCVEFLTHLVCVCVRAWVCWGFLIPLNPWLIGYKVLLTTMAPRAIVITALFKKQVLRMVRVTFLATFANPRRTIWHSYFVC